MTTSTTFNFKAALAASESPVWQDIVAHAYRLAYQPSDYPYARVTPVPRELQKHVVDYEVTQESLITGDKRTKLVELKTEKWPANYISVEYLNAIESNTPGWTRKKVDIHGQDLLTIWRDGTVFLEDFDKYKNWLHKKPFRLYEAEKTLGKPTTYRTLHLKNPGYTTETFLLPVAELRKAFGDESFYQLEGEWLKLAQDSIDAITRANEGSAK